MPQKSFLFLVLATISMFSCAQKNGAAPPVEIQIEHQRSANSIRVQWNLESDARLLVFPRGAGFRNAQSWIPLDSGVTLKRIAGYDVLESPSSRRNFSVQVKVGLSDVAGDYSFMTPFSDGGLVLYTSHLQTSAAECRQECSEDVVLSAASLSPSTIQLEVLPSVNELVAVNGAVRRAAEKFDESNQGSIVYFGDQIPSQEQGFKIIADPMLPKWILPEAKKLLPQILAHNAKQLSKSLPVPPIVFLPYVSSFNRFNSSYAGAVVGPHVVLALYGSAWRNSSAGRRLEFQKFAAHEAFHLWNTSLYHAEATDGASWLHEGSADLFGALSLFETGVIDKKTFVSIMGESLNRCMVGVNATPLVDSNAAWNHRNHYHCGSMVELLLKSSLQRRGSTLWSFWSELFDRSEEGYYNQKLFLDLIAEKTQDSVTLDNIKKITSERKLEPNDSLTPLEEFFVSAFSSVGIQLKIDDRAWPLWYSRHVAERALGLAIENDCAGDGYFVDAVIGVRVVGGRSCQALRGDQSLVRIDGFVLWSEGVNAYDSLYYTCRRGARSEVLNDQGARVNFPCPNLPVRPRYTKFTASFGR